MAQNLCQASQHVHNLSNDSFRHSTLQLLCHPSLIRSVLITFSSIVYLGSFLFYINSIIFLRDFFDKQFETQFFLINDNFIWFGKCLLLQGILIFVPTWHFYSISFVIKTVLSLIFIPNQSNYIVNLLWNST